MSKDLVNWKQQLAADAKKVVKEESSGNYISLKSGCMTYQDAPIPDNTLECVVIASTTERTYYNRPYDPDDIGPPDCFAQALEKGGMVPHANVPNPVHPTCDGCPMAEFGSAKQGKGPACKTRRKLMVMPSGGVHNPAEAETAVMAVPPTSVKNYSTYINKVASVTGLPPWAVVTKITVKPDPKKQFTVSFESVEPIESEEALANIHSMIEAAEQGLMKPYSYDEVEEKAPVKKLKGQE